MLCPPSAERARRRLARVPEVDHRTWITSPAFIVWPPFGWTSVSLGVPFEAAPVVTQPVVVGVIVTVSGPFRVIWLFRSGVTLQTGWPASFSRVFGSGPGYQRMKASPAATLMATLVAPTVIPSRCEPAAMRSKWLPTWRSVSCKYVYVGVTARAGAALETRRPKVAAAATRRRWMDIGGLKISFTIA